MEMELYSFIFVWSTVLASLCYCHNIGKLFPQGRSRLFAVLPIVFLFLLLPLMLTSVHFGGIAGFFISWLASFKLILFATGRGPLSTNPFLPLPRFITFACLPIRAREEKGPSNENHKAIDFPTPHDKGPLVVGKSILDAGKSMANQKSPLNYITKLMLLVMCIQMYDYNSFLHPNIVYFLYALHIYFTTELVLAIVGAAARAAVGVELEPPFNEPYLATSLQDFWGRRWNLLVTNILRQAVYDPVRHSVSAAFLRQKTLRNASPTTPRWASMTAVLATFFVSGAMHELLFYGLGRVGPTGEVTCFFLLHGLCVVAETLVKKALRHKFQLPGIVSGPLAIGFVIYSSFWLFFPPLLRGQVDVRACKESLAFIEFVKFGRIVCPSNLTCPYFSPAQPK